MRPVRPRPARAAGFTLIEVLIGLVIFSITLAIGIPMMSNWLMSSRAGSASEFYAEGMRLARAQAVSHNAAARYTMVENTSNHQLDWQVDICFPTPAVPCNAGSGSWSTTTTPASGDPEGANGYKSVVRSSARLPKPDFLQQTLHPDGATDIYFTPLGWVDTAFAPRLTRLDLVPASGHEGEFPSSAIAVTLAGMVSRCDPTRTAPDSRACPP